jgi:hypothetical protein
MNITQDHDLISNLPNSPQLLSDEEKYVMDMCFPPQVHSVSTGAQVGKAAKVSIVSVLVFVVVTVLLPKFKTPIQKTLVAASVTIAIATAINYFVFFQT